MLVQVQHAQLTSWFADMRYAFISRIDYLHFQYIVRDYSWIEMNWIEMPV